MKTKIIEVTAAGENSATFYRWNFPEELQEGILHFCKISNMQLDEIKNYLERFGKKERTPVRYFARQIGIEEIEDFNEAEPPSKADYDKLQEFVNRATGRIMESGCSAFGLPDKEGCKVLTRHIDKFTTIAQGLLFFVRAYASNPATISL